MVANGLDCVQPLGRAEKPKGPSDEVRWRVSYWDGSDSRRVLKPDLEVACGPRHLSAA